MEFDVVIVTYNSRHCLPTVIASVGRFFGEDTRLHIVDNGSSDGSAAAARSLAPRATVIENESNLGFAAAVNRARADCRGDVVVLVNPDVSRIEGSLRDVSRIFEADARTAVVATRMVDEAGHLKRSCHSNLTPFAMLGEYLSLHERFPDWGRARAYRMLDWDMSDGREVDDACGGFLFIVREAFTDVGPFDERFFLYCEESDWILRARRRGWKAIFTPVVVAVHAGAESSGEDGETVSRLLLESQYLYLRKHFGLAAEISTRAAMTSAEIARAIRVSLSDVGRTRRRSARVTLGRVGTHLGRRVRGAARSSSVRRAMQGD